MIYYTSVTSENPKPAPKLHLFWVCEPNKKGSNIRAWGATKQEARDKLNATYPTAKILWKKEL
tara:strand:- start:1880 stop:2068 length:189 start_codon:yes stop_codon:yes gene_type:complete